MKKLFKLYFIITLLLLCGCSCNFTPEVIDMTEPCNRSVFAMNTYIVLTAYGENSESALVQTEDTIKDLEELWSVTDKNSEIYALNHSNGKPCTVSDTTADILNFSLGFARKTNGVVDPTVYPVLSAWGFNTESRRIPNDDELADALSRVGYEKVLTDGQSITVPVGTQLDLGAVAKGYAGDILIDDLKKQGITSALLNLGGNVQALGTKPNGEKWQIGLRCPDSEQNIGVLEIANCAVITSGNYQKYFIGEDGKRYHHIIDLETGKPAESGIVSATVIGKEGKLCDALSTALFIMGEEKATDYWRANDNFEMILLTDDNRIIITEGIAADFSLKAEYDYYEMTVIEK